MRTLITTSYKAAADYISRNQVAAFPTETVYGLGANAFESDAVKKIYAAKGRPSDNPLIVHVGSVEQIPSVVSSIPKQAEKLIEEFFPGPLTLVLPKNKRISALATAGLSTVGVRIPKHELAQKFLIECGLPVAAPSANLSGSPSPTSWQAVKNDLNGRIPCILKGDPSRVGVESTVVDCTGSSPVILRAGGVTLGTAARGDLIHAAAETADEGAEEPRCEIPSLFTLCVRVHRQRGKRNGADETIGVYRTQFRREERVRNEEDLSE
jgi:L-threonylcarbamoyladenylate synthase